MTMNQNDLLSNSPPASTPQTFGPKEFSRLIRKILPATNPVNEPARMITLTQAELIILSKATEGIQIDINQHSSATRKKEVKIGYFN